MGKYRMYEPYGYQEESDYLSKKAMLYNEVMKNRENDKQEFHSIDDLYEKAVNNAYYDNDLESVIFKNVNGEAICSIKMTDIFPSKLVKSAEYDKDTQHLIITFDNDDTIDIDLNDLISNLEPGDGLILDNSKFAVLIADNSEKFVSGSGESFLTVDANGVKIDHIQEAIDIEKERALEAERVEREARVAQDNVLLGLINTEKSRAIGEESRIETKLDNEISDRNTQNNRHDSSIASLESRVSALESRVSSLQNSYNSLDARIRALEGRI